MSHNRREALRDEERYGTSAITTQCPPVTTGDNHCVMTKDMERQ